MNKWKSNFNESFNHLKDQIGEIGIACTIQDDDVHAASDEENVKGQKDKIRAMHEDEEQAMVDSLCHFIFNPSCLSQIPISSPPQWISFPQLASALSWGPSKLSFLRKQLQIETRQQEKEHVSSSTRNDSRGTKWSFDPGGTVIGCKINMDPKPSKALKLLQSIRPIHLSNNQQPNPNENEGQSSTNSNREEYGKQAFQVFNKIQPWDWSFLLKNSCNLDEAITDGAAIQAANLGDVGNEKILISRYTTHPFHPYPDILKEYPDHIKLIFHECKASQMSLYIGNLLAKTWRDELENAFRRFGCCSVQFKKDGYGFVVFNYRLDVACNLFDEMHEETLADATEHIFQFREEDPNTNAHLAENLRGKKFFAHHLLVVLLLRGVFEPFDRGRESFDILLGFICSRTSQFALDMKGVLSCNGSHLASTYSALAMLKVDGKVRNESSKNYIERQLIENDGQGLHNLALNKMVLDVLNFYMIDLVKISIENLELMARNCVSLVFVKVSDCEISFHTANALEEFYGGSFNDHPCKYSSVLVPQKLCRKLLYGRLVGNRSGLKPVE
ncbi:hypothetical protein I3842_03G223300 [Carya illinoinensis]|uniref:Uncharacterized protein n=1 Tax=Carya illinoinensis TaxID=32201 RepID=A0A922FMZ8_CARIL|nr:hypothetical protein I3842_03G223300 [Carya illinoinensis]